MPAHHFSSRTSAAGFAADLITEIAGRAIAARGVFRLSISAGTTPKAMFKALVSRPVPWTRTHIFWVDERNVEPDAPESNYRMARTSFLNSVPLPLENIHRMKGELLSAGAAARQYEQVIASCFDMSPVSDSRSSGSDIAFPEFDCIHLGMGGDGHVASLFPGSPALEETRRWVIPVTAPRHASPPVSRITLTLPVLNRAASLVILVAGQDRIDLIDRLPDNPELPAAHLRRGAGVHWVSSL